jgi:O-antigen/teichoic acid export membrane protein
MGIIIKQSAISTALTYAGVVIGYVNLLILYPAYMSPEEVGLARIVQDAAMLMVPFAQLGIGQLILRYFPAHRNKAEYSEFVGLILLFLAIAITLFTIIFFAFNGTITSYFSQQSPEVINYIFYILVLIIILTIHQVMVAFSQSSLNIILPNFLKEVVLRAVTLSGIILFAGGILTFSGFIYLLLGAYLLNLIILSVHLIRNRILRISFNRSFFNIENIKPMLKFGLFTFLGGSGILIIGKVDSIMVTGMLGLKATAIYTTAFYIAVLIELPKRAIAQISMPVISRAFKENNQQEIKEI